MKRCGWVPENDALYCDYHDTEWGVPIYDDQSLFEKLILDGFQAGLSWRTILYKREAFREAFDEFDPEKIVNYDQRKIDQLMQNKAIIRSGSKINATLGNARAWLTIMEQGEGAFRDYLWAFVDHKPVVTKLDDSKKMPTQTPASVAMSKQLKKDGFKFCGPVIVYAFMQAVGMINDHETSCPRHKAVKALKR